MPGANHVVLSARIAEAASLRHTPAGIPALDLKLVHESEALEAGTCRRVRVEVKAVAFGADAEALARQAVGTSWRFTGFLAQPRGGRHPVLHIQSFQQDQI